MEKGKEELTKALTYHADTRALMIKVKPRGNDWE